MTRFSQQRNEEGIPKVKTLRFDEHQLRNRLSSLEPTRIVLFGAACSARLFAKSEGAMARLHIGEPDVIRSIFRAIAQRAVEQGIDAAWATPRLETIKQQIPDLDGRQDVPESEAVNAQVAQHTIMALTAALRAGTGRASERGASAARIVYEALDAMTIEALGCAEANADEEDILASEDIQTELARQQQSLESLELTEESLAAALRRFWPCEALPHKGVRVT